MKTCTTCLLSKPKSEFHVDNATKDKLSYKCKQCRSQRRIGHKRRRSAREEAASIRTEKPCTRCGITKSLPHFCGNSKAIDGTTGICRECHKKVQNKYYNTKARVDRVEKKNEAKLYFAKKQGGSCTDCGITPSEEWPMECFDFHHVGEKSFDVARVFNIISKKSMPRLEEEIKKCIFLCSNCHRRRHSVRHSANRSTPRFTHDLDAIATKQSPAFVAVEYPPAQLPHDNTHCRIHSAQHA